ncbi:hypothetical protein CN568_07230 [Bacillus pseudomycoides]|uniref:hypothetical protein n=1 Tax=Bacillus pseudomycoides TaxID=64104 RepID=UPI000BF16CCC|nr:hypothetical protein [Bacillus pseudomycoides]PEK33325.1 hypothetical protein CN691_15235 [Bacillus pseudomycoides]PEK69806.1 hypothetical protein CN593_07850 [Bacillus pseudomycoides]PEP44017.1 hypothetical protein CN565_06585 [Bacillus pseudomycoides]PEP46537.1 hypothetical protein CN568_07230 [Bacillus pseudomycoides]PFX58181.1 hypothetical protein COL31_05695 [Bacillus pseudomycoides]
MNMRLNMEETQFLNEVLEELKQYQISSKNRKIIKQQLLEHIQECREHGQDSLNDLGDTTTFIKDFLEMNEIDLHSEIKQIRKSKNRTGILFVIGFFTSIVTYLISQLLLSMFLTESFNPLHTNNSFDYNILYQIADNSWWNYLLMITSVSISILISTLIVFYIRKVNISR